MLRNEKRVETLLVCHPFFLSQYALSKPKSRVGSRINKKGVLSINIKIWNRSKWKRQALILPSLPSLLRADAPPVKKPPRRRHKTRKPAWHFCSRWSPLSALLFSDKSASCESRVSKKPGPLGPGFCFPKKSLLGINGIFWLYRFSIEQGDRYIHRLCFA